MYIEFGGTSPFMMKEQRQRYINQAVYTDKQMEDIPHLYDILKLNRVFDLLNYIPENELNELHNKIHNEAVNLDQYLNSLMGIMKTITTDYSNTEMKVDELTDKLNDPKAFETVKEILNKIG